MEIKGTGGDIIDAFLLLLLPFWRNTFSVFFFLGAKLVTTSSPLKYTSIFVQFQTAFKQVQYVRSGVSVFSPISPSGP